MLIIDGEIGIGAGIGKDWVSYYIDYFILQAYGATTDSALSGRLKGVIRDLGNWINDKTITTEEVIRRTIFTENFESFAGTGGGFLGMSKYVHKDNDINQQIGGCGLYRSGFDYDQGKGDYNGSPEYYFLRQGIHNMYRIYNERKNPVEPAPAPEKP